VDNIVLLKHRINWGLDENKVRLLTLNVLKKFGLRGVELSLFFTGKKTAKKFNVKYRKMNYVPQVLSFSFNTHRDSDGLMRLGDIVICSEKLKQESRRGQKNVYVVLAEWLEHGLTDLI